MIVPGFDFFSIERAVLFVRRRSQGQVTACGHGDVAGSIDLAGDGADVSRCNDLEVAARLDDRAVLSGAVAMGQRACNLAVALF